MGIVAIFCNLDVSHCNVYPAMAPNLPCTIHIECQPGLFVILRDLLFPRWLKNKNLNQSDSSLQKPDTWVIRVASSITLRGKYFRETSNNDACRNVSVYL